MKTSLVLLAAVPALERLDQILDRLGWRGSLLAEVAPSAADTPTHRGLRASVSGDLAEALEIAVREDRGLDGSVVVNIRPDEQRHGHFDAILKVADLVRLSNPDLT